MKTIEEKTKLSDKKCIQFKERTNEPDYVIIQDGNGCSSMVNIFKIIFCLSYSKCLRRTAVLKPKNRVLGIKFKDLNLKSLHALQILDFTA